MPELNRPASIDNHLFRPPCFAPRMKLATYRDGSRDGQARRRLRVTSTAHYASGIATRMQQVLDDWNRPQPAARRPHQTLDHGKARHAFPEARVRGAAARFQWADGSAFINHVELVRKARGAEVPESFYSDPLMYQGGSDDFLGPTDDIVRAQRGFRHRLWPRWPGSPPT